MTRLTVNLTAAQTEALDWIKRGDATYRPDNHHRREAIGGILMDHVHELRGRIDREGSVERALQALRDERDALRAEPDALRRERDALRKALEAERKTRRRDRERFAGNRRSLANAIAAGARLTESRDRYRDLAVRVEAALLGAPPSDDFDGLARRLARALRRAGYEMLDMPRRKPLSTKKPPRKDRNGSG